MWDPNVCCVSSNQEFTVLESTQWLVPHNAELMPYKIVLIEYVLKINKSDFIEKCFVKFAIKSR